jgi:hypothetical protein
VTTTDDATAEIDGFLPEAIEAPDGGGRYAGRLRLTNVQWVNNEDERMVTCTVTARQILDWSESSMLWTDQTMQRGIKAEAPPGTATLLPLRDGYPDPKLYVFHAEKADAMATALTEGRKLFLSPLTWNLRPGTFEAFYDPDDKSLTVYKGKVFLPDSHHRHQAIALAMRVFDESNPGECDPHLPDRQFTVNLYFMPKMDEGEFFYEKNILGTPTAKSKAYDLTDQDAAASLAKEMIRQSPSLLGNVNRVTDRLTARNRQVVTLSTLRGLVEAAVDATTIDPSTVESTGALLAEFYEMLVGVRPELGQLDLADRVRTRRDLLSDSAVMMHAYGQLAGRFIREAHEDELVEVKARWAARLAALSPGNERVVNDYPGDLFDKANPVWREEGILQLTKSGTLTVSNTRQTRARCHDVLNRAMSEQ